MIPDSWLGWLRWGGVVAGLLVVVGVVDRCRDYRATARQVEPLRQKWKTAKQQGEAYAEALRTSRERWEDSVQVLNARRDSLQRERRSARAEQKKAADAADVAAEDLEGTLDGLARRVRPELRPVVDTAQAQLARLNRKRQQEREAAEGQIRSLEGLLSQARRRRDYWKGRADSAMALAEARLERALAAEKERDVWKSEAKWDILEDGPKTLLHAAVGVAAWEGMQAAF